MIILKKICQNLTWKNSEVTIDQGWCKRVSKEAGQERR
jgi:hypothetical protein